MTDPRLERLRSLDAEATPGPWSNDGGVLRQWGHGDVAVVTDPAHGALIAAMRNAWPAVVALVESVLERHKALGNLTGNCRYCQPHAIPWPCPEAKAALAVLDTLGEA